MSQETTQVSHETLKKIIGTASKSIPYISRANFGRELLGKASKEIIGYDFVGLVTKLGFFYLAAFTVLKYFEAVIGGSLGFQAIAKLVGINLNPAVPDNVIKFFRDGVTIKAGDLPNHINPVILKPWDIVNLVAFLLLIAEAITYFQTNKKLGGTFSWFTVGVWGMIIGGFYLLAINPILTRFKNPQNVTGPPNVGPAWLPTGYSYSIGTDGKYYALMMNGSWQQAIMDSSTTGHLSGINLVRVP